MNKILWNKEFFKCIFDNFAKEAWDEIFDLTDNQRLIYIKNYILSTFSFNKSNIEQVFDWSGSSSVGEDIRNLCIKWSNEFKNKGTCTSNK